jgi:hypothetical protein
MKSWQASQRRLRKESRTSPKQKILTKQLCPVCVSIPSLFVDHVADPEERMNSNGSISSAVYDQNMKNKCMFEIPNLRPGERRRDPTDAKRRYLACGFNMSV